MLCDLFGANLDYYSTAWHRLSAPSQGGNGGSAYFLAAITVLVRASPSLVSHSFSLDEARCRIQGDKTHRLYRDGDLGSWSSFALRVGNPEQTVRVIPATAGQSTWVIAPLGCHPDEPGTSAFLSCQESRGGLFNASQSNSWLALGNHSLGLDASLGYGDFGAVYGLDTITLGFSDSIGSPTIGSQVLAALAPKHYYTGLFGLNHQATNLTDYTDPHPSFLATMKKNSMITSLSWGYTAGAQYRRSFPPSAGSREPRYKYIFIGDRNDLVPRIVRAIQYRCTFEIN